MSRPLKILAGILIFPAKFSEPDTLYFAMMKVVRFLAAVSLIDKNMNGFELRNSFILFDVYYVYPTEYFRDAAVHYERVFLAAMWRD